MKTTELMGHNKDSPKRNIALSAHIKSPQRSQMNNLILHLKLLEKQGQAQPKTEGWK
jgi:hypothetical protein